MLIAASLILSVPELILLLFGAIILGITIHFFITSRKSLKATAKELGREKGLASDEWKMRYLNDMEIREKELNDLKQHVTLLKQRAEEAEENASIYAIEAEEMRKDNQKLKTDLANLPKEASVTPVIHRHVDKADYIDQLRQAQAGLTEQNQRINQLIGNIDMLREKEEMHRAILRDNAELTVQVNNLRHDLAEKEKEVGAIKQKEQLTKEMTSMLDSAYSEFNVLQSKIQKLETQLTSSRMLNLEYEDLKEEHSNLTREAEEQKQKLNLLSNENQQLQIQLVETEDKLREANFQRQQLQKKISYLEELNNDLHMVADANKKLEGQLKRMGELESLLNVTSEERDRLKDENQ
jgi:uncharacterized phage infection (PIP) family protein YhgE